MKPLLEVCSCRLTFVHHSQPARAVYSCTHPLLGVLALAHFACQEEPDTRADKMILSGCRRRAVLPAGFLAGVDQACEAQQLAVDWVAGRPRDPRRDQFNTFMQVGALGVLITKPASRWDTGSRHCPKECDQAGSAASSFYLTKLTVGRRPVRRAWRRAAQRG